MRCPAGRQRAGLVRHPMCQSGRGCVGRVRLAGVQVCLCCAAFCVGLRTSSGPVSARKPLPRPAVMVAAA